MKQINSDFSFHPARNAEHYQLHSDLLAAITASFAEAMAIAPLRAEYARLFDIENECYLRNAAYRDTPEVEAKDRLRDNRFIYVSQRITTAQLSPVAEEAEAAARLAYHLAPYRDAPRLNYASNTAAVADFVQRMRETANAADIATLGLAAAIDALATANDDFNLVYAGRSTELLTRSTSETMKTIRPQVDAAYRALASAINALYQVNELVTKDATKEKDTGAVIDRVNALLIQLQSTLSRAGVGAKPGARPDDKPVTPPSGGGTPVTPDTPGGSDSSDQDDDILK